MEDLDDTNVLNKNTGLIEIAEPKQYIVFEAYYKCGYASTSTYTEEQFIKKIFDLFTESNQNNLNYLRRNLLPPSVRKKITKEIKDLTDKYPKFNIQEKISWALDYGKRVICAQEGYGWTSVIEVKGICTLIKHIK